MPRLTTPDAVEALLADDERLTPEQRQALADLFRVAYEQIMDEPTKRRRGRFRIPRSLQFAAEGTVSVGEQILNILKRDGEIIKSETPFQDGAHLASTEYHLIYPDFDEIDDDDDAPLYECHHFVGVGDEPFRLGEMRRVPTASETKI